MSSNPPLQRLGDAVLLQGAALLQCRALVFRAVRESSKRDGIVPSANTRDLLQVLDEAASAYQKCRQMSPIRHGDMDIRPDMEGCDTEELVGIGTATVAQILGITVRQAQRLASRLGAQKTLSGSLSFDRVAVLEYQKLRQR